ncbi:torsin-1A-interacting protein 2-like isoform X2 [Hoplias malabaricus]|uniref:torsin-1A-interacting protein 2-like isoform X2 n=1 Tax=Hoplias malabaricus TaxID=27720 RepID=UPI003461941C
MDSMYSKTPSVVTRRRSARQSHKQAVFAVRARAPLKRHNELLKDATVNGSEDKDSIPNFEGTPGKLSRLQMSGDGLKNEEENMVEMDVAAHVEKDQEMSSEDESKSFEFVRQIEESSVIRTLKVGNLETEEMKTFLRMQEHCPKLPKVIEGQNMASDSQSSSKGSSKTSSAIDDRPLENRQDILTVRSSIRQYRDKMEEKVRDVASSGCPSWERYPKSEYPTSCITQTNSVPKKQPMPHKHTETKKIVATKATSVSHTKGYVWYVCRPLQWAFFLLASLTLGLLGYQHLPASSFLNITQQQDRMVPSANFEAQLATIKPLFPNQRSELWSRTEIHLKRHLKLNDPREPVSMMLTAGRRAEKTLGCLAQHLARAFSAALNTSVVDIDGASKTAQDSDQVKLDIDTVLREAFDGGKQAAVIHHFEELPPGSTLIFYRYCDHENAAYKKVFLAFTVLLPVDELHSKLSLSEVEEQVLEYLKNRFVSSDRTAMFNKMDVDKLSGLWSRISHLILPVAAEQMMEQHGCRG